MEGDLDSFDWNAFLLELAERGIKIVGLNYKDDSAKALQWLADLGDPYAISLADIEGVFGLDLGVYGAPETYIVDAAGVVRFRHVGVLDPEVWRADFAPWFDSEKVGEAL